jgi:hypothetical protein
VQVSPEEWKKYGAEPRDMAGTEPLLQEVVDDAYAHGFRVLNGLPALRAAEPGAFVAGDLHMSAKGQAALGAAMATVWKAPPPAPQPLDGLPDGRSRVPFPAEWLEGDEVASGCTVSRLREWIKLECVASPELGEPVGLSAEGSLEVLVGSDHGVWRLVAPLQANYPLTATVSGTKSSYKLAFDAGHPLAPEKETTAAVPSVAPACTLPDGEYGNFDHGCSTLEGCADQVACATGSRGALPLCHAGEANAGAAGWCMPLCGPKQPCTVGVCTPWQGTYVCL